MIRSTGMAPAQASLLGALLNQPQQIQVGGERERDREREREREEREREREREERRDERVSSRPSAPSYSLQRRTTGAD